MVLKNYEEIVGNFVSPTLVLAGPGAGKTHLLADRIKHLLNNNIEKEKITVLTYVTDAKENMINKLVDPNGNFKIQYLSLPQISTMHSLGFQIIFENPHYVNLLKTSLGVQDDDDVKKLIFRDAALILNFTENDGKESIKCKQYGDCKEDTKKICNKYWEIMSKLNRIDFDDQILFACTILEHNPVILEKYQSKAQHLLVDEYQDINSAQFKLIELLSRKSRNGLFVVGDDAQSIYGFRGADPKFILRFTEDFPGSETPPLPISRRCHKKIMDDAIKVLQKYYKEWKGSPPQEYCVKTDGEPEQPSIWQLPSDIAEAHMVAKITKHFIPKKTVLILVPKKEFFPLISKELCNLNVPHECPLDLLPERIRIAKHFIDWVIKPDDNFSTRLVIEDLINKGIAHVPGAKKNGRCKPETIMKRISIETEIAKLWEYVNKKNNLFLVINNIENPSETIVNIRIALTKLLETFNNFKGENQGEFVKQLSVLAGFWNDPSKFAEDITSVVEILQSQRPTGPGSVELKTMRKAKGLEADIVIIVGLEDDIVPNPISNIEEEARRFYVSMTRAREKLYLFHSYKRPRDISYGNEITNKPRSIFLDAIGRASEYKQ